MAHKQLPKQRALKASKTKQVNETRDDHWKKVDRLRKRDWRAAQRAERPVVDIDRILRPVEKRRSDVFTAELARLALEYRGRGASRSSKPKVLEFREAYFGGRALTEREAATFFSSYAVRLLSAEDFTKYGIPVIGHHDAVDKRPYFLSMAGIRREWVLTVQWGAAEVRNVSVVRDCAPSEDPFPDLIARHPGWGMYWHDFQDVLAGSVFAKLVTLSQELAAAYLWSEGEAAHFVISGRLPIALAIRVRSEAPDPDPDDHVQQRLVLSVYPWVSATSVMKLYRTFQRMILKRDNRPPQPHRLELFHFVSAMKHEGHSWRSIQETWNAVHPELAYPPEAVRNFQRDFGDIYQLLVGKPAYRKRPRSARNSDRRPSLSTKKKSGKGRSSEVPKGGTRKGRSGGD